MNRFPVENIDKVEEAESAVLASKATQLETSRTIKLTGDVTGSASFNGTGDASITATVADDSHNHTIANVDNLQSTLDAKGVKLTVSGKTVKLLDANDNELSSITTQDTNTTYTAATATPKAPGTAAVGTSAKYAREDHIHPLQTSVTSATKATQDASGNTITSSYAASMEVSGSTITLKSKSGATLSTGTVSATATSAAKLSTARTITIPRDWTLYSNSTYYVGNGSISFDGSADKTFACSSCMTACTTACSSSCKGGCGGSCDYCSSNT